MSFDILGWKFTDEKGQEFSAKQIGSSPSIKEAAYDDFHYSIPKNVDMDNIITIEIDHYPNYISEPFKIRIK